jgi:hypothetical protein
LVSLCSTQAAVHEPCASCVFYLHPNYRHGTCSRTGSGEKLLTVLHCVDCCFLLLICRESCAFSWRRSFRRWELSFRCFLFVAKACLLTHGPLDLDYASQLLFDLKNFARSFF